MPVQNSVRLFCAYNQRILIYYFFGMNIQYTNRLINETSPYLLQHAHNPVDWYPWGDEALQKSIDENKPILVSIGYSACHWCHVMERESFENVETAEIMNKHFVNIKIDREERPVKLFTFNETRKEFKFPIVIEDEETPQGRVTNKFITYRFNGTHFVRLN